MKTVRLTTAQAIVRFLIAQRTVIDGRGVAALPGRVRDLRPRQRHRPRLRARRGARRAADDPRPERAGHGAGRGRLRQGDAAAPDHGRHVLGRTRRHEHGHGGRRRDGEPAALLLLSGDTFQSRIPDPVLQQVEHFGVPVDHGQRRVPGGDALLGPHRPSRAGRPVAAAGRRDDARPRRLRPGVHRPAAGRPGGGIRLPGAALRAAGARASAPAARCGRARRGGRRSAHAHSGRSSSPGGGVHYSLAEDELRRFVETHGLPVVETVAGKSCLAPTTRATSARSASRAATTRTGSPPRPTSCSAWAPGCRTSRPVRGPSSGTTSSTLIGLNAARFDATKHLSLPRGRRRARRAVGAGTRVSKAGRRTRAGSRRHERRPPLSSRSSRTTTAPDERATDVCAGDRRGQPRGNRERLRTHGRGRLPRRAQRELAVKGRRDVRLRVRLLVHGLRDRRCVGREDGAIRTAT